MVVYEYLIKLNICLIRIRLMKGDTCVGLFHDGGIVLLLRYTSCFEDANWWLLRRSQRLRIQLLPPLHAVRRTKCKTLSDTVALLHIRTHFKQKLSIFLGYFTFVWRVHCRRVWCSGELATICIAHNHRAGQQGDNLRYLRSAHITITHIYRVSLALASLSSLGRWCSLVGWYSDSEEKAL